VEQEMNTIWFAFHFSLMMFVISMPVMGFLKPDYLVVFLGFLGWVIEFFYWFKVARLRDNYES
jgi:hypothetical protein